MSIQSRQDCFSFSFSPGLFRVRTGAVALFPIVLFLLVIQGCITPKRLPALFLTLIRQPLLSPGIPKARFWLHSNQGVDNLLEHDLEMWRLRQELADVTEDLDIFKKALTIFSKRTK